MAVDNLRTEINKANLTATKVLFCKTLAPGWNDIFTVPARKNMVISNIWARAATDSELTFEVTYAGGAAVECWGVVLESTLPQKRNFHEEGAMVFEAGTALRINATASTGIKLDGAEIAQT